MKKLAIGIDDSIGNDKGLVLTWKNDTGYKKYGGYSEITIKADHYNILCARISEGKHYSDDCIEIDEANAIIGVYGFQLVESTVLKDIISGYEDRKMSECHKLAIEGILSEYRRDS